MENEHYKYLTQRVGQVQNKHNHHSNYSKQFVLTMISLKKITWRLKTVTRPTSSKTRTQEQRQHTDHMFDMYALMSN